MKPSVSSRLMAHVVFDDSVVRLAYIGANSYVLFFFIEKKVNQIINFILMSDRKMNIILIRYLILFLMKSMMILHNII